MRWLSVKKNRINMIRRISLIMVGAFVLTVFCVGLFYYLHVRVIIEEEVNKSRNSIMEYYIKNVNANMRMYKNLAIFLSYCDEMQQLLKSSGQSDAIRQQKYGDVRNAFYYLCIASGCPRSVEDVTVYLKNNWYLKTDGVAKYEQTVENSWYRSLTYPMLNVQYVQDDVLPSYLSVVKPIVGVTDATMSEMVGLVKLDVLKETLFGSIKLMEESVDLFVYDKNENLIYMSNPLLDNAETSGTVMKRYLDFGEMKTVFIFRENIIKEKIFDTVAVISLVTVFIGGLMLILMILYSRRYARRLDILMRKMDVVRKGSLNIGPGIGGNDEIARIDTIFGEMIAALHNMINENYEQKILTREAELKALQSQINPHFLYNTLECIRSLADVIDAKDIAEAAGDLGDLFRYSLGGNMLHPVTLRDELEHVKKYLAIQNIRFGNQITVVFEIPGELLEYKMPKLILQPLIENAFKHGYRNTAQKGYIEVSACRDGGNTLITVWDNGEGIEPDELARLNQKLAEDIPFDEDSQSIGLQNVNLRLRYFFGQSYGLYLDSIPGIGTKVIVRLP